VITEGDKQMGKRRGESHEEGPVLLGTAAGPVQMSAFRVLAMSKG